MYKDLTYKDLSKQENIIMLNIEKILTQKKGRFFFVLFCFCCFFFVVVVFFFVFLLFLWAAPAAYGGSQDRGPIGAVAASLRQSHSNAGSEPRLLPTPQLTATPDRIVNPLSKGRDRTRNLVVPSRIR